MQTCKSKRWIAMFLLVMMLFSIVPAPAFATEELADPSILETEETIVTENDTHSSTPSILTMISDEEEEEEIATASALRFGGCDFYGVVSDKEYALAPGAIEREIVINDADGTNRNVLHVIEVDLSNEEISVMPTYKGLEEGIDFEDSNTWGTQVLTEQAKHVEEDLGLNVVGGINTNLRYGNNHPYGVLVWNGVVYSDERNANGVSTAKTFLSVTKDGKASLHSASEPIPEDSYNAISANFEWILKDGESKYPTDDHTSDKAPRTVIGIKEDGTLVLMMNDGRQSPYSAGTNMRECAEIMLELGCVDAVNCDGGGSSTFISEREGTGQLTMKSSPSDGGQRATLGGLLVISHAAADGEFHHATVSTEESYVTPGSTVLFTATGADASGAPAEIPEHVTWQMKDDSFGTVEDGEFISSGKCGEAVVQLLYNGKVVGKASVNVVIPEAISFVQQNITVPFGKTAVLNMTATTNNGLNTVTLKPEDISFTLSDEKLGTISGFAYTSCEETAGVTSGTVNAVLVYDTDKTAEAVITLGKGSEVVWDFEDGDISGLSIGSGYSSKHPKHPELGRFEFGDIKVVTKEDGQVKNGEKALAVICNFSDFYAMGYNMLRLSGLDVDLTDAVRVGFWVYLTPEATGIELDFENWYEFNSGDAGSEKYPEDGWYYVSVDATKISKSKFNNLNMYHTDGYDAATNNNIPNIKTQFTMYIDDITVDYSTVVEDREAPVFKHISVLKDADTYVEMNGQTVDSNSITVMAEAMEDMEKTNYTGINPASANVFVDGVEVTDGISCSSNGVINVDNITLSDGIHTFRFEIADNAGNTRSMTRQIVINGEDAPVRYVPKDSTLTNLPIGSTYYMNLEAENVEDIQSVTAVLDLDGSNDWELDHMVVADGFTADYTIDEDNNDVTITVTRSGSPDTDSNVLVSIPIHVWEYTLHLDYPDCVKDGKGCEFIDLPSAMWKSDGNFRISVITNVEKGEIVYTDGDKDTFSSENYIVDTECNKHRNLLSQAEKDSKASWHIHTPVAVEDKEATCKEEGFTGRVICAGCSCGNTADNPCDTFGGCGRILEWGTVTEKTDHVYNLTDGVLKCDCGKLFNGTKDGVEYMDGIAVGDGWKGDYYYVNGQKVTGPYLIDGVMHSFDETGKYLPDELYTGFYQDENGWMYFLDNSAASGWIQSGGNWYYFLPDKYAATGTQMIDGLSYKFDGEQGKVIGAWKETENGTRFYFCKTYYKNTWAEIEGATYYFDNSGYRYEGTVATTKSGTYLGAYEFDSEGRFIENITGVFQDARTGLYHYADNGVLFNKGLVEYDGDIYYARSNYQLATTEWYVGAESLNGILESAGTYVFGADGKLQLPGGPREVDGILYFYLNGVQQYGLGLVEYDGDIYYVRGNGRLATTSWWVDTNMLNGLAPVAGMYNFGADGKMILDNGPKEVDGALYFYIDGVQQYGLGLVEYEGDIYYVRGNGRLATTSWWVDTSMLNGLAPVAGNYTFGADGKMVLDNGPKDVNGVLYYYIDGVQQYGLGLVEYDGDIYYVRGNGRLATTSWWVDTSMLNGLAPVAGNYTFGADGKMILDNGPKDVNGTLYYYIDGIQQYGLGLVEYEGDIYYVRGNGRLATTSWWVDTNMLNGLAPKAGTYTFAADGKMVQ